MYGRVLNVEPGDKMKLPFPIRGTTEWDDREYERHLLDCKCLSFGPIDEGVIYVKPVINKYLMYYEGVNE